MRSELLMGCSFLRPLGSDAIIPAGVDLLTHIIKSWQTDFQNLKSLAFLVAICIGIWKPLMNTKQLKICNKNSRLKYLTKFLCKSSRSLIKLFALLMITVSRPDTWAGFPEGPWRKDTTVKTWWETVPKFLCRHT